MFHSKHVGDSSAFVPLLKYLCTPTIGLRYFNAFLNTVEVSSEVRFCFSFNLAKFSRNNQIQATEALLLLI